MRRVIFLSATLSLLCGSGIVRGDDADEIKLLKKEIELFKAKLEAANLKIEKLERENELLKGNKLTTEKEDTKKKTLSELLTPETVLTGDWAGTAAGADSGTLTVTITERTGNKLKGTWLAKATNKDAFPEREIVGEISDNKLTLRPVNTVAKWTCTLTFKGQALEGFNVLSDGTRAKIALKVPK
jgi:hypothetical protein